MKYSQSFVTPAKSSKEFDSANATYLQKAGFINQTMAGVYSFLPLGMRVLRKIEKIVREEMDTIGQEILMPGMAPMEFWQKTGRLESVDVIFKAVGANERSLLNNSTEYVLNSTHEDVVTPLVKSYSRSYKDFPFAVYQIQTKFRNEARPKSGLLRLREFIMKDLYSFHLTEQDLMEFYNGAATDAYNKVYYRLGLGDDTYETFASGGDFTEEFSKEFQVKLETGEDVIFRVPTTGVCYNKEIAPSKAPKFKQDSKKEKMEVINTPGVIGMEQLPEFLGVPAEKCMKTLIYETKSGDVMVVGLRGTYEVNELKLAKVSGEKEFRLASEETVKKVTGAEIGYAGVVGLPNDVKIFIDDSMEDAVNFECGGNKTDHHNVNVNWDVDVPRPEKFYDLKVAKAGDSDPESGEIYESFKASEAGNIFPLGTKYSESFGYMYIDQDGKEKPVYMASYGIGISRIMGILAEKFSDDRGLKWPISVSPYHVHMIDLGNSKSVALSAEELYKDLWSLNVETLWDDRKDVSAGVKFNDSDLIGCPIRVLISDKSLEQDSVEVKMREGGEPVMVRMEEAAQYIRGKIPVGV